MITDKIKARLRLITDVEEVSPLPLWLRGVLRHPKIFLLGVREARTDSGLTWPDDDNRNEAYDSGRALARALLMLD